jgi:hypothetical protein
MRREYANVCREGDGREQDKRERRLEKQSSEHIVRALPGKTWGSQSVAERKSRIAVGGCERGGDGAVMRA